jgi:hypothetical protein
MGLAGFFGQASNPFDMHSDILKVLIRLPE